MKQVFPIIPASTAPWIVLVPAFVVLLGLVALFVWFAYSSRHVRFEVSSDGLKIAGDMYGRMIPGQDLITAQARILDLTKDTDYALARRTNGTGLPGYRAGWFRLRNGEKALAFVTDTKSVAYVPTRAGYSVLVSVAEPGRFLEAIKAVR